MIRLGKASAGAERTPLREALGLAESSGSVYGSTSYKRAATCFRADRLYTLGVRKSGPKSDNLDFGDAFHLILEAYYRARQQGKSWRDACALGWSVLDPLQRMPDYEEMLTMLDRVVASYFDLAAGDDWNVVAVEEELVYRGLAFDYSARLDLVIEDGGELWVCEHKTTKVITDNMMTGYLLDLQTIGQIWLMHQCVDLTKYAPFGGVIVNLTSKQAVPRHERVRVRATQAHLAEFERHLALRTKVNAYAAELGYPKMFGHCSGPAQYFGNCQYFDLCHGRPDFDVVGVDKLHTDDLPFGFVVVDSPAPT